MPRSHAILLGGAAALVCASAASASTDRWNTTTVELPDGSTAEIQYVGDIPPRVSISAPVVQDTGAVIEGAAGQEIAYGGLPRARRVIQAPTQPAPAISAPAIPAQPAPPQFIIAGDAPKGSTYEYTLITTGADGRVCTQRTEWTSRGKGREPEVKQRDAGDGCATLAAPPASPAPAPVLTPTPRIEPIDPDSI